MRARAGTAIGSIVAVVAASLASLVVLAGPAGAVVVNDEASLRAALANDAETSIELAADIVLDDCGAAERSSTTDLVIEGNGFSITQTCIDENLKQAESGRLTLNRLTLIGGVVGIESNGPVELNGSVVTQVVGTGGAAAIFTSNGDPVTLVDSLIDSVTADDTAYGIFVAGGGAISLTSSRITGIEGTEVVAAGTDEGGLTMVGSSVDGIVGSELAFGVIADGAVVIDTSVIRDVAGGLGIGAYSGDDVLTVTRSTIATITTDESGAIGLLGAATEVRNSTITGVDGPAFLGDSVTVVYSDMVGNGGEINISAVEAIGLVDGADVGPLATEEAQLWADEIRLFGSVVTDPQNGVGNCTSEGVVTSQGYNFADDDTCALTATGDRQGAGLDPLLGTLADNGGPTPTLLPQTGSLLLEAIPAAACQSGPAAGITIDQRGEPRPGFVSCDIGSVELQPAPVIEPTFTG